MSLQETEIKITPGGKENISHATRVLSAAFIADPTLAYIYGAHDIPTRIASLPAFFRVLLTAAAADGATIDGVNDWQSCGVFLPPGSRVDRTWPLLRAGILGVLWTIGFKGFKRLDEELSRQMAKCKAKWLKGQKRYFYIYFLGTLKEARGRGLCSRLLEYYKAIAEKEALPIWMEASTEDAMRLYKKAGWQMLEVLEFGKGIANADGALCEGGPGVKIWAMIWYPTKKQESTMETSPH